MRLTREINDASVQAKPGPYNSFSFENLDWNNREHAREKHVEREQPAASGQEQPVGLDSEPGGRTYVPNPVSRAAWAIVRPPPVMNGEPMTTGESPAGGGHTKSLHVPTP